jgi:hypothetical protein
LLKVGGDCDKAASLVALSISLLVFVESKQPGLEVLDMKQTIERAEARDWPGLKFGPRLVHLEGTPASLLQGDRRHYQPKLHQSPNKSLRGSMCNQLKHHEYLKASYLRVTRLAVNCCCKYSLQFAHVPLPDHPDRVELYYYFQCE